MDRIIKIKSEKPCTLVAMVRLAKGWGQAEFAAMVGVDPSFVSKLERGERRARRPMAIAIAAKLGLPLDDEVLGSIGRSELVDWELDLTINQEVEAEAEAEEEEVAP